jgi:hypothetical protein
MMCNSMRLQVQTSGEGMAAETSCANEDRILQLGIRHRAHLADTVMTKFPLDS